jgi:peptidase M1-like protein
MSVRPVRSAALLLLPLIPAAVFAQTTATGVISQPLSPRNANYTIAARLDTAAHAMTATETIHWRNITRNQATELQFHLYWNAWRDNRSTYMREEMLGAIRPNADAADAPESDRSRIDVTAIRLTLPGAATADLTSAQHFIAPDDGNQDDRTVMAVPLPRPVGPGESATIEIAWSAHVPRTFDRTGVVGNFYFIAQWFPKLGVLQDEGWNCHQFHSSTEFFSDYGTYNVSMTVPRAWIVGATGVERDRHDNTDGTTTHRYYQDDVHDFAWTTSPDYLEHVARFEHPTLPPITMRLLLQPEHEQQADRHFAATRITLRRYGEWYGAYPYGHITIVDPAYHSGAGGMEYPTLFTAGTRWLAPEGVAVPESVIVHEAGHQWWYGIVGNNEFEDAWLDEGLNQFSEGRALAVARVPSFYQARFFGGFIPYVFPGIPLTREIDSNSLRGYRAVAKQDAQSTPSYRYFPTSAGGITYAKTALWLNTLEQWIGWPVLQRSMSTYFARWKFAHPKPRDFFATVNEVSGRNLDGFFDQVYRSSNVFDYGVDDLTTARDGDAYRTTVIVRRYGEAIFPVDVRVTFANEEIVTERWDGVDRWKAYVYSKPSTARSAEVDPEHILLLDVNWTNNSKTLEPNGPRAATKWSLAWLTWLEDCVLAWASLA